jgi:hypothetical protein
MCQISEAKIHRRCKTPTEPPTVFIMKDGKQIGLCNNCWNKVADSDLEWGSDPRPILKDILERREKEEALTTLTEYKPHEKGAKRYHKVGTIEDDISSHGLDRPIEEEVTPEEEMAEAEGKALMEEDEEKEQEELAAAEEKDNG